MKMVRGSTLLALREMILCRSQSGKLVANFEKASDTAVSLDDSSSKTSAVGQRDQEHSERSSNTAVGQTDIQSLQANHTDRASLWAPEDRLSTVAAEAEGARYKERYLRQLQFVFSRVQEHQHLQTKKGLVPLKACMNTRSKGKCKHGFPKQLNLRCRVICLGNYRQFKLRISGRRNSFGSIFGRRSREYQSGTV